MLHFNVHLHKSTSSSNQQGFTLLELLVVVLMIGILSAIATPSILAEFARTKLNNSLDTLQSALELSQAEATRKSRKCEVYIPEPGGNPGTQIIPECNINVPSTVTTLSSSYNGSPPAIPLNEGISITSNLVATSARTAVVATATTPAITARPATKVVAYSFKGTTNSDFASTTAQPKVTIILSATNTSLQKCLIVEPGVGLISTGNIESGACVISE
jgi:prepilin-type N-terminal cleavage/methylation domain-containing protein